MNALDVHTVAKQLSVTEQTVYRLIRSGRLPHTRVGRALRVRKVDLDAYLEEQTSTCWEPHAKGGQF